MHSNPFDLDRHDAYARWRDARLGVLPACAEDLIVEVRDPRQLSPAERAALAERLRVANMAIYASAQHDADKEIPRRLGTAFGLQRLDCNWLADEEGISSVTVAAGGTRGDFIPYTDKPIRWHTDGYYNEPERRVWSLLLHCVRPAAEGGENALFDHELAYLLMREAEPAYVRALMAPDAMTIPPRTDASGEVRAAVSGPVFHVDPASGRLHMRYTARTRSIAWKDDSTTRAAVAWLEALLAQDQPGLYRLRLQAGMGLICANVLHDRAGFNDDPQAPRLLYRARYHDPLRLADPAG